MNRYTKQGVAEDLECGENIGIVGAPYDSRQNIISQLLEYLDENYVIVHHSTGTVEHDSGGTVTVYPSIDTQERLRGTYHTVLLVPYDTAPDYVRQRQNGAEVIEY